MGCEKEEYTPFLLREASDLLKGRCRDRVEGRFLALRRESRKASSAARRRCVMALREMGETPFNKGGTASARFVL